MPPEVPPSLSSWPGRPAATWAGRDARGQRISSGVHVVRLAFGGQMESMRVALLP